MPSIMVLTPNRDLDLERIESALTRLETDPELASKAPAEIARARETVRALNAATTDREKAQLAYPLIEISGAKNMLQYDR